MITLKDGHWYRSKEALARSAALRLIDAPHVTPDGYAVLVLDLRGVVQQPVPDGPPKSVVLPPAMVMQADHGHDLQQVVTNGLQPRIERSGVSPRGSRGPRTTHRVRPPAFLAAGLQRLSQRA